MTRTQITISDVAKLARVSTATVSYVLNNKPGVKPDTRANVLRVMSDLKYQPSLEARRLRRNHRQGRARGKTGMILFVTHEVDEYSTRHYFERDYTEGLLDGAERHGCRLMIQRTRCLRDFLTEARNHEMDGIITNICDYQLTVALSEICPIVLLGNFIAADPVVSVISDNQDGIRQVVRHLHGLGHRCIWFSTADPGHASFHEREIGFRTAMAELGLPCEESFIQGKPPACLSFGQKALPSAIVCTNDSWASDVMRELAGLNVRVPDQVSVTGFDDIDIACHTSPPLTTVRVPRRKMAALAVEHLVRKINDPDAVNCRVVVPVELVVRESTAPATGGP